MLVSSMTSFSDPLSKKQKIELLRSELYAEQQSFISHWRDLNDYILPRRGRFYTRDVNRGDRRNSKIVDSTATLASRVLQAGMMSSITSPARPWFNLTLADRDLAEFGPVREWLHTVRSRMMTVFNRSNLYSALPTLYGDMGVFATGAMAVLESPHTVIRCYPFPVGSYMIALNEELLVRVFIREYTMSVRQIVLQFGVQEDGTINWSNISVHVKNLWDRHQYEQRVDIVHYVAENMSYDSSKALSKFKPIASCYYEKGSDMRDAGSEDKFLRESGFDEFPILVPRWEVTGEDSYGTNCPGMTALGDIKQIQLGEKWGMMAIEKMARPPMVAPIEMKTVRASILPGDITYASERDGQKGFRPAHEVTPRIQELEIKQAQARQRIDHAFFKDLFLMLAAFDPRMGVQPRTAREIEERHEEKLIALGPMLENLNQDVLDPLIHRTYGIMDRNGMIPLPPEELEGLDFEVEYISIMHQAQKRIGLEGMDRLVMFVSPLAETDPSVWDKIDRDEMIDQYADMSGVPPQVIVPDEEVQQVRAARAQEQQLAKQAEQMAMMAQGAKTLSQADTSGKNALTDVLRNQQRGGLA